MPEQYPSDWNPAIAGVWGEIRIYREKLPSFVLHCRKIEGLYVSPSSKFKTKTIDHVVETIHFLRSEYDNDISFLLGGDLNQLNINYILQSYGALKQLVTDATRDSAILEFIITDLQGFYHPPSCIAPLQVDPNEQGKDSDHNIVMFPPISFQNTGPKRKKKTIITRLLPDSQVEKFGKFITSHNWDEVF